MIDLLFFASETMEFHRKTKTTARQNYFTIAAINDWNSLPERIISSENVTIFRARLDKLWASEMYDASFLE